MVESACGADEACRGWR